MCEFQEILPLIPRLKKIKWKDIAFMLDSLTERKRKLIQLKQTIDLLKWVLENE